MHDAEIRPHAPTRRMRTPADGSLARTLWRITSSGRVDLAARTLAERRAWPLRLGEIPTTTDPASVDATIRNGIGWIAHGQDYWRCGGIPAGYNARTRRYDGPYPETTGYSIPTLLALGQDRRASRAAEWLVSRQLGNGAIRCNIEPPGTTAPAPEEIVIFDCGAILQGLTAMARRKVPYEAPARRLAEFLVATQAASGTWDRHLAFPAFGSHNALVGYALLEAGVTLDAPAIRDAGHRCLAALRPRLRPDGYIEGCEFPGVRPGVAFLHPFVYTIEGFLKAEEIAPGHGYLDAVRPALDALHDEIRRTDRVPGAFVNADLTTSTGFTALTAIAQLADVGFKADRMDDAGRYSGISRRLMHLLRACCASSLDDAEWVGGLPSAYPIDGGYLPFCVNNWGLKYLLDASLEERHTLDTSGGTP